MLPMWECQPLLSNPLECGHNRSIFRTQLYEHGTSSMYTGNIPCCTDSFSPQQIFVCCHKLLVDVASTMLRYHWITWPFCPHPLHCLALHSKMWTWRRSMRPTVGVCSKKVWIGVFQFPMSCIISLQSEMGWVRVVTLTKLIFRTGCSSCASSLNFPLQYNTGTGNWSLSKNI